MTTTVRACPVTPNGPRPGGGRRPFSWCADGSRPRSAAGGAGPAYRQRMDMTRPATMSPKPIRKFHAPSADMTGSSSPAT